MQSRILSRILPKQYGGVRYVLCTYIVSTYRIT